MTFEHGGMWCLWTYSKHCADVEGVIYASEEISIVTDLHWQMCFRLMLWKHGSLLQCRVVFEDLGVGCVLREHIL